MIEKHCFKYDPLQWTLVFDQSSCTHRSKWAKSCCTFWTVNIWSPAITLVVICSVLTCEALEATRMRCSCGGQTDTTQYSEFVMFNHDIHCVIVFFYIFIETLSTSEIMINCFRWIQQRLKRLSGHFYPTTGSRRGFGVANGSLELTFRPPYLLKPAFLVGSSGRTGISEASPLHLS